MSAAGGRRTSVLVVFSSNSEREDLGCFLAGAGYLVAEAADNAAAVSALRDGDFDIVIAETDGAGVDGHALLRAIKDESWPSTCLLVSSDGSWDTALSAMQAGAFDYKVRPVRHEDWLIALHRALPPGGALPDAAPAARRHRFDGFVGQSRPMQDVFRLVDKVADTDSTVLVQGESGTGKELVARALHESSKRRDRYLIPVNCGAIPETLLESELFGHVKGAFTGATTHRIGRFEAADNGTLFLDEIGDMSPALQVKLLRVLQAHEFEPVGSTKTRKVDVRVIAATNRRLEELVAAGKFREDLYYRLSVIPIYIPPLRERTDDIPLLANHFLEHFCRQRRRKLKPFGPDVTEVFRRYEWPGNVRELENLVERLVILAEGDRITLSDLPDKFLQEKATVVPETTTIPDDGIDFNRLVDDFENQLIHTALTKARGNKNLAAQYLGLKRTTLVEKLKKKGIGVNS